MSKVELYTWSYCPYCNRAKQLLESKGIPYSDYPIDGNDRKKNELYSKTGQNTVPFVFIDDNFIGGCSELQELDASGKLDKLCE